MKTTVTHNFIRAAVIIMLCFGYNQAFADAMSGNYSIGSENADFENISDAVAALHENGVNGAVVFLIQPGDYYEQVTINEIKGASAGNNITFTSETAENTSVVWSYASTRGSQNFTLYLNGTDHINFRNLTIEASGIDYARCVYIAGSSENKTFDNVIFNAEITNAKGQNVALVYSPNGSNDDKTMFKYCEFNGGGAAISLNGSGSFNDMEVSTVVDGCNFFDQYEAAIDLFYHDAPQVTNNIIQTASTYSEYAAIRLVNCNNNLVVERNIIRQEYGRYGIYLNNCEGTKEKPGSIRNNSIYQNGQFSTNGIYLSGNTHYQNFEFNKVKIAASMTDNLASFYTNNSNGQYIVLTNNIFFNLGDAGYSVVGNYIKLANFEVRPNDLQKTYLSVKRVTKDIDVTMENIATFNDPDMFVQ
jgi:hypothetical protein